MLFRIIRSAQNVAGALAVLGMLLVLSGGVVAQATTDWRKFEPADKGFSVLLPAVPEKVELPIPKTTAVNNMQTYIAVSGDMNYLIVSAEVANVDWKLRTSRDNFMAGLQSSSCAANVNAGNRCEVALLPELLHKGHQARDFKVVVNGEIVGIGRAVFVGTMTYTVMMSGYGADKRSADSRKFLDSFEPAVKVTPKLAA